MKMGVMSLCPSVACDWTYSWPEPRPVGIRHEDIEQEVRRLYAVAERAFEEHLMEHMRAD